MEQDIEYFAPLEPQDGMDAVERNMIGLHNRLAAVLDDYVEFVDDPQVQGVQSVQGASGGVPERQRKHDDEVGQYPQNQKPCVGWNCRWFRPTPLPIVFRRSRRLSPCPIRR